MRYLVEAENTLIVRGPASFLLLNGEASVLGGPVIPKVSMVVRSEKQVPIEVHSEVDLEINLGNQGNVFEVQGSTIPASWAAAAEALLDVEEGNVMIIGATDIGKSSLATYLSNKLIKEHVACAIVDGDVGQADIGPPTTVGRAVTSDYIPSLLDIKPERLIFIGHITPSQVEAKLIRGIHRLSNLNDQSLTIINTDGWVLEPEAVIYKIRMIEAVQPALILGIAYGSELQPILTGSKGRSLRLEAPQTVLARSRSDRRELRNASYRRFLNGGYFQTISLDDVTLTLPDQLRSIRGRSNEDLRGLVLGFLDKEDFTTQIGILIKLENNSLQLFSRPVSGIRRIEVGYVKLATNGEELGYLDL